jgi:hypothetical protein
MGIETTLGRTTIIVPEELSLQPNTKYLGVARCKGGDLGLVTGYFEGTTRQFAVRSYYPAVQDFFREVAALDANSTGFRYLKSTLQFPDFEVGPLSDEQRAILNAAPIAPPKRPVNRSGSSYSLPQ